MTRARTTLVVATVLALLVGIAVYAAFATRDDTSFSAPKPVDAPAPKGLEKFYDQKVSWSSCGDAECAWVTVPIDYAKPEGETTRIRVKVHPGKDATRSLFVNPGGPGGSALDFSDRMVEQLGSSVRDMYDIVGVDPRGVGESSPLKCLPPKEFDTFVATDPDPDDDAEITALRKSSETLGEACLANSGPLAAHVSTVEAARDMDVVRALLGRKKLDWFGASYGTQLGAVYAELFPDKVGRMVLDGAVDPTLDAVGSSFAQTTGFQRALEAYVKSCVKQSNCPLGDNAEAGMAKIATLLDQLDQKPLKLPDGRELTEGNAFYGIAVTLYDQQTWDYLTQALRAAFDGDGSVLMALSDAYFERNQDGSYATNGGQVIYAVNCLDAGGKGLTVDETKAELPRFEKASPVFGASLGWGALGCSDWPIKATNPLPDIDAKGAPPILVIGTTRDPATPYESAQALASQLDSGVLLTREGDGHTAYVSGNKCIVKIVDNYLVKGKAPKNGTVCKES
ncbi:alpha/beta hydrolase [Aeromicrobium yanjiei]|uniref:Alpha/beta fold hydrolase n=1 Tax=Aeromicrobium yanjiei TaxID=2662028 RepID=A0A5Q2MGN2_9ACTN|nr:alpha/beta hydrolase [Aeromicrobium yanjiei]QGG40202.1 alpha/beta fold hydrolase [Aeromicrobium yanjiei]